MARFGSDNRPIISRGPSLVARFLLLAGISVALMVADHRNDYLTQVRSVLSTGLYPLQWLVDAPFRATNWIIESVTDRSKLRQENTQLATQLRDARVNLQTLAALTAENQRLRELADAADDVSKKRLVAQIMRVDLDPLRHRVLLNKGQTEGVFKGQPILDAHGIFGQITQVGRHTSEAILISDPEHAIPVRVNRSGLRTIAVGTGNLNKLDLPFLTGEADIKVGDLLIASGLGGVFPAGYPVGIVTRMERDPAETFATVEAKPLAKLDSDYEVVLIWYQPPTVEEAIMPAAATAVKPVSIEVLEAATKPAVKPAVSASSSSNTASP
ncbi:MAG: rod shape-determining protein MreC [Steroidobacteraceae bacterium]